jgi:GT2 family glycosyltransferase
LNNLSVIIPSKLASNLIPCVSAVKQCEPNARIIVVDDGLQFQNAELRQFIYGSATVIPGISPFVFSRNVNLGIQAAGTDDVIILGDDGLLETPGGFTLLQNAANDHPEFGIIAATTNNTGNVNQLPQGKGLREESRMVCFICILIPRRTIDLVGLMDEEFVGYGVDDDAYCYRVRQAGLKIGIHDGAFVDHASLQSTFRGPAGAGGDFRPNLKIFIQKYGVDNWGRTKEASDFPQLFA